MVLQLILMWSIVAMTLVWFVRDERRTRRDKMERQALLFATAPAWRHRGPGER